MSAILTLEYEPKDTVFHRMNPLAKVVLYLFIMSLAFVWWDPIYLTIACAVTAIMCWRAKLPGPMAKIILTLFAVVAVTSTIFHPAWLFQSDPNYFKKLPAETVTHIVFAIPQGFPFAGFPITLGKLIYLYSYLARYLLPMMVVFLFLYTVNPSDLVQMMIQMRLPNTIVFMFLSIFRFFSLFTRMLTNIINAQSLRGWSWKTKNPVVLIKRAAPLFAPLGRGFISMIDVATVSISNRGFELALKMAPLRQYRPGIWEKAIIYLLPPLFFILWYLTTLPPYYVGNI
jgi:energy-coupling factor transporter transmembrane protein EcfT